jgi:hypothetical protein
MQKTLAKLVRILTSCQPAVLVVLMLLVYRPAWAATLHLAELQQKQAVTPLLPTGRGGDSEEYALVTAL